jgi:hypothetical protein
MPIATTEDQVHDLREILTQGNVLEQYHMIERATSHMLDQGRLAQPGAATPLRFHLIPKTTTEI